MLHLQTISAAELRNAFTDEDGVQATKWLMIAIIYNQGVSQTDLARWHGLSRKAVYNWLYRFEEDSVRAAARDKFRLGRPPKLDHQE